MMPSTRSRINVCMLYCVMCDVRPGSFFVRGTNEILIVSDNFIQSVLLMHLSLCVNYGLTLK